ncbi:Dihydrofolate reductase [Nocardioides exalbidus]|uniref:Dihydrofolate reductase n=1 Tax=Nocardioides exalbidus TaxID=402596 RepID=A0A1H4MXQ8_9ACTN|nr:dihydrofolate reductase family protein [Nocardioides exalbidus]SEB87428.1 Dihydrofolate reductase [Nocardioides exalbidus]
MGTITVDQIVTADGFAAESDGGLSFFGAFDPALAEDGRTDHGQLAWLETVDAMLLGRRTYEMFSSYWPTPASDGDEVAGWINAAPKHVVSSTLDAAPWGDHPAAELHRDPVAAVADLRERYGSVVVWGSLDLTDALFTAGEVDVLRLRTVPVVIGSGRSFVPASLGSQRLALDGSTTQVTGHVATSYRVLR